MNTVKEYILYRNKNYYEQNNERLINYQLKYNYIKLLLEEQKEHHMETA